MPGSSEPPSNESTKAKVTSATSNGGVFVRPVAVAGIFCPASESGNKSPALPEKRRFSALVGDLRPCPSSSVPTTDDFNRRRQSWDTRQKEVPFSQALLRKTPRKTPNATTPSAKEENESSKVSNSEKNTPLSDGILNKTILSEKSTNNTEVTKSSIQTNRLSSASSSDDKLKLPSSQPPTEKSRASFGIKYNFDEQNCSNNTVVSTNEKINCLQKSNQFSPTANSLESSPIESKSAADPNVFKRSTLETDSTTENKQPKKVYGLIKRESKSELDNVQKSTITENKDLTTNAQPVKKVYGLNKNLFKKDNDKPGPEKLPTQPKIASDSSFLNNDNTAVVESREILNVTEVSQESSRKSSVSPPKEFRTVRRTSDVIAAKIQNIFSNFQSEKPKIPAPKKLQITSKKEIPDVLKKDEDRTLNETEKLTCEQSLIDVSFTKSTGTNSVANSVTKPNIIGTTANEKLDSRKNVDKDKTVEIDFNSNEKDFKNKLVNNKNEKQTFKTAFHCSQNAELVNCSPSSEVKSSHPPSVSKTDLSINSLSSKPQDKKFADIEGNMPTKKADQNNSSVMGSSLITNGDSDRKSSDVSASLYSTVESAIKNSEGVKKQSVQMSDTVLGRFSDQNTTKFSQASVVKISNSFEISTNKMIESCSTQKSSVSSTYSSQTCVTSSSLQNSCYSSSKFSKSSLQKEFHERSKTFTNGKDNTEEISKLEITKIAPVTVSGIIPSVNVLFRTKSPQSNAIRDENRKKVVIETNSNDVPLTAVINPSNSTAETSSYNCVASSVKEALKTVKDVQKCLNTSPSLQKKYSIVNLKKDELATVSLTANSDNKECPTKSNDIYPNNSINSYSNKDKQEKIITESNKAEKQNISVSAFSDTKESVIKSESTTSNPSDSDFSATKLENNLGKAMGSETKLSVVDLGEWNKKFQSSDLEPPRVPLRRRALRESLPPSLPLRSVSRYGSLKRIEDAPRYIPRSPSHSTIPQRYSYTEMLTKVCSMGVLPFIEPVSKSCSSSSSQVSELWSELSEEQSTATHASEMLEAETTERMRLEKEVHELQNRYSQVQQRSDKMEMEMIENRMYRSPEINGDLSDEDETDGNISLYRQKYERAIRDMEIMKRRMQQLQEEEMEQKAMMKKASEKRLAEALEDIEEERQIANQWKRKAQKLGAELQDVRLMLEEQMGRNGELEKKQRKFDAELSSAQEEIKKEKQMKEKLMREKDQAISEKYQLEQDLQSSKLDSDLLHEKIAQLNRELDELTLSSKGEEEVTQLKRTKQELERKNRDQEEELEELAAQVQMLEQAKLRLEMSLEKVRQEHRREASVREEEIEEIRASFSKKIKNLEAQLESEQDERHQLMKQKHELERRIYELADQPPPQDPEIERRLRRDLKRTKALLRDAQSMLEHTREGQSSKTLIRQLKNQLEDSEFAKVTAVKARQAIETELQECQLQLEEITRVKNEAESRCLQLSREKSAIQTQLEEAEEEMAEVMKKYKSVVAQMSIDQKTLAEQNQQIAELETERQMLKDQLSEVSHKFEHLAGQSDDTHKVHWLDSKIRDLESKLELEQTTKTRLENQIARLKEQNDRSREESDSLRNKEMQAQEGVRRLQRQVRELREDYSALQQKEADAYRKQHELEMALENTETDLQVTKNDLRLACQRIQDLQNALEDDLDSGTDVPDDSGSDSDDSFELSVLKNQSVTPVQRCDSVASNLSYCTTEDIRSRTSSFSRELSAFSRMMLRRVSMDYLG